MIFIVNTKSRTHVELHSHNVFCARFLNIKDDRDFFNFFFFILIFSTNYATIYKMMLLYANCKLFSNYLANIDYYWSNKKRK